MKKFYLFTIAYFAFFAPLVILLFYLIYGGREAWAKITFSPLPVNISELLPEEDFPLRPQRIRKKKKVILYSPSMHLKIGTKALYKSYFKKAAQHFKTINLNYALKYTFLLSGLNPQIKIKKYPIKTKVTAAILGKNQIFRQKYYAVKKCVNILDEEKFKDVCYEEMDDVNILNKDLSLILNMRKVRSKVELLRSFCNYSEKRNNERLLMYCISTLSYFDDIKTTIRLQKTLISINPSRKNKEELIYYYILAKELQIGLEMQLKIIKEEGASFISYYQLGQLYFLLDNYDGALQSFFKAAELNPINEQIYNNIGYTYYNKKDYKNTEKYYIKAIKLNPKYKLVVKKLVLLYEELDYKSKYDKMLAYYNKLKKVLKKK